MSDMVKGWRAEASEDNCKREGKRKQNEDGKKTPSLFTAETTETRMWIYSQKSFRQSVKEMWMDLLFLSKQLEAFSLFFFLFEILSKDV